MSRATRVILGVVVLAAGSALFGTSPARSADTTPCFNFSGTGAADAVRTAVSSPETALLGVIDSEGPAVRVHVDSLGNSQGWAGAPYPGDVGLFGYNTAVRPAGSPAYPFMAQSSHPTEPEGTTSVPPYELRSRSEALSSSATAEGGDGEGEDGATTAGLSRARAAVSCDPDGETVSASADNVAEALSFGGGVFRIGRVHSTAKVVIDSAGDPTLSSSLEVSQMTVAGQSVQLTEKGLVAGQSASPLTADDPFQAVLGEAGIRVTYVEAVRQPDGKGVVAPGMMVTVSNAQAGEVTYTFGRAFATADSVPGGDPAAAPPPPAAPSATTGPGPSPAPGPEVTVRPSTLQPRAAPTPVPRGDPVPGGQTPVSVVVPELSIASLYLALVVGGIALLVAGSFIRKIGVRLQWT